MRMLVGLCVILHVLCSGSLALAQDRMIISTVENSIVAVFANSIISAAYKKLGIEVEIYETAGTRSLVLSSQGTVDGELMRIYQVGEKYPDLRRIEIPGFFVNGVVFVRDTDLDKLQIEDLPTKRVGHVVGVVQAERFTEGFADIWEAQNDDELFSLLSAGRLEAAVSNTISGLLAMRKLGLDNIKVMGEPFKVDQFYHYVHKKHEDLVPKLTTTLKNMYLSGEIDAIHHEVMTRLVKRFEPEADGASKK
ncbi:MAG: transporter substrate-binding domain-containing protein [Roseibium sp.]